MSSECLVYFIFLLLMLPLLLITLLAFILKNMPAININVNLPSPVQPTTEDLPPTGEVHADLEQDKAMSEMLTAAQRIQAIFLDEEQIDVPGVKHDAGGN